MKNFVSMFSSRTPHGKFLFQILAFRRAASLSLIRRRAWDTALASALSSAASPAAAKVAEAVRRARKKREEAEAAAKEER